MAVKPNKESAEQIYKQATELFDKFELDKAHLLFNKIFKMAKSGTVEPVTLMRAFNSCGLTYYQQNNFDKAEEYLLQSMQIAKQLNNPTAIAVRYDNLASVYTRKDDLRKAIDCLEMARQFREKAGDHKFYAQTLLNLANRYVDIEDLEMAEKYLNDALPLIKKHKFTQAYIYYYTCKGSIAEKKGDYKNAVLQWGKSLRYALMFDMFDFAARKYYNQGNAYLLLKQWNRAEKKMLQSARLSQKYKLLPVEITAYTQLGIIAIEKNDVNKARQHYEHVKALIKPDDIIMLQEGFAELEWRLFEAEGNYRQALEANKNYLVYYKKHYDKDMKTSLQNVQGKYEAEKKDRALEKAKLLQAQSELKALRAQMDPHFIFNALNSMRKELLSGNVDGADTYLVRFSRLLRLILDTSRTPSIRLSDNIELLHLYIQIEKSRQGNRFDYSITTKGIDPDAVYVPGLILQPLAENAIVHGLYHKKNGQGKLTISFTKQKNNLVIKVRDNGVGRNASRAKAKPGHTSHAMAIINETLDLVWQGSTLKNYFSVKDLITKDNINIGTEVTVLLPL